MLSRLRLPTLLCIFIAAAFSLVACDPLAPDPTTVVVIVTPTDTPLPTLIVQPTASFTPSVTPTATLTPTPRPTNTPNPTITATATPSLTPTVCTDTVGQIVDLRFKSAIAKLNVPYRVYLPPCYSQTGKRYPLAILMHGSDRDETEWTDLLDVNGKLERGLALGALPPMILVMPYGGELANSNSEFGVRETWEDVVVDELMPEVERNFCTWNDRAGRAIGGISRGGFWAFEIGLRHPDLFSAIGGHSAFFDEDHIAKKYAATYNPLFLVETLTLPARLQPRIYLDVGADDYALNPIEEFHDKLVEHKIDADFVLNSTGEHNIDYWKSHVTEYLSFYGQTWPRNVSELPSCLS